VVSSLQVVDDLLHEVVGSRMPATLAPMPVRRIMPYHESSDFDATRAFYTGVLGLDEGAFGGGWIAPARSTSRGACGASSFAIRTAS
jgi:hypothetical protein